MTTGATQLKKDKLRQREQRNHFHSVAVHFSQICRVLSAGFVRVQFISSLPVSAFLLHNRRKNKHNGSVQIYFSTRGGLNNASMLIILNNYFLFVCVCVCDRVCVCVCVCVIA